MWNKKPATESNRYYYSDEKLFEKSLDVYKPVVNGDNKDDIASASSNLPVVILVVGSGWMGHRAFVYAQTSWWNSSGPKTVASLGCTCVCIRHRGAFCVLPPASVLGQYLAALLAVLWIATGGQWQFALAVTAVLAFILVLLALGGRGSADFDDMLNDVAEALSWVNSNRQLLKIKNVTTSKSERSLTSSAKLTRKPTADTASSSCPSSSDSESESASTFSPTTSSQQSSTALDQGITTTPFVFGGYSSGGHVAATLLQHPELFQKYNLPSPEELFKGIVFISGVLSVRPETIAVKQPMSDKQQENSSTPSTTTISTPQGPRWLTDLIVQFVWGPERAKTVPSPVAAPQEPKSHPNLPHLLVGCRNEMFGLKWLDIFFSSKAFCDKVRAVTGQPAKYVQVESDHWNILNSTVLRDALQKELPLLVRSSSSS